MSQHLSFMLKSVEDSVHSLMKAARMAKRALDGKSGAHVVALQIEKVIFNGTPREIRRLFVKAPDSGDYCNTGWILLNDVDNCMICNKEFGVFRGKMHCRSCGNVICSDCAPEKAEILEILSVGEQIVCIQCDWGQGEVLCVRNLLPETLDDGPKKAANVSITVALATAKFKKGGSSKNSNPQAEEEEIKAKAAAEAYEKELLERIKVSSGRSPGNTLVTLAPPSDGTTQVPVTSPVSTKKVIQQTPKKVVVTPTPGYVMKTKKNGTEKVFINVCYHDDVVDLESIFASSPKMTTDKNGSQSQVFDVVIAAESLQMVLHDDTMEKQQETGLRIIKFINDNHGAQLDSKFTTPLIKNNYKGDSVTEMPITVLQFDESIQDVTSGESCTSLENNSQSDAVRNNDGSIVTPVPGVVIQSTHLKMKSPVFINLCCHESVPLTEKPVLFTGAERNCLADAKYPKGYTVYDVLIHPTTLEAVLNISDEDLKQQKLEELCGKVIKVLRINSDQIDTHFMLPPDIEGNYHSDSNGGVCLFQMPVNQKGPKNLLITPFPGFVLQCKKAKRSRDKEEIFINITHHSSLLRPENQKYYMLCSDFEYALNPLNNSTCMVYMVVVHSELVEFMIRDKTGQSRDQLCTEVVTLVNSNFSAGLSMDVTIPMIEGGYLGQGAIKQIINIPPADKEVATDHMGFLYKQGHGYKTWKGRTMLLQGRSLKYFDGDKMKGTIDIKDAVVEDCPFSECNAPETSFPFKITTPHEHYYMYATEEEDRLVWKTVIEAKALAIRIATTDAQGNRLLLRRGYLKKEGHLVRNWKKRFVVLDMGVLIYYEKEAAGNKLNPPRAPLGDVEKGRITLAGATVSKENVDGRLGVNMNRIYISGKNVEDLLLEADTEVAADAWFKDIKEHIEFADNNPHLVDSDANDTKLLMAGTAEVKRLSGKAGKNAEDLGASRGTFSFLRKNSSS